MTLGHLYVVYTTLTRPPKDKLAICVCDVRNLFLWINTDARGRGICQMPLAANDHAALTRACHLDCSRVTTFLGSELAAVNVRGYMFFDPALCRATVLVGPASNVDITVKKNGALWATIAFATGATDGVISFATPNTSAQAGDRLVFYGPAIRDPQMAGFSTTLASA